MDLLVIDTSVAIKWIISENEKNLAQSDRLLSDIKSGKVKCYAPELLKYEVGNVMISKHATASYIDLALKTIYALPLEFIAHDITLAKETVDISKENNMTFYDASFIALAQRLGADLITDNIKHQGKYTGKKIRIIPLKNYR